MDQTMLDSPKLFTTSEVADLLGLKPNTLERWRVFGGGPAFVKTGSRVRYTEKDIVAWVEAQRRTNTSQARRQRATDSQSA